MSMSTVETGDGPATTVTQQSMRVNSLMRAKNKP